MSMMLIDQTKDSACKTAEADAIRAKTGGSAQLAYDWANGKGFADAIAAIPTGGGGDETWYDAHGILYKAHMEIPSSVIGPRYVREAYQEATHLVSYLQPYGTPSLDSDYGLFRYCSALETVWVARATFGNYCFESCRALKTITLGRVGLAVTSVQNGVFAKGYMKNIETITVYVNASDLSEVPSAVADRIVPTYSHGAVITYRNYSSGDVIATVTVP